MTLLKTLHWSNLTADEQRTSLLRPKAGRDPQVQSDVSAIIQAVRSRGDQAVLEYTRKFDAAQISSLIVSNVEIESARSQVSEDILLALKDAIVRIRAFHEKQKGSSLRVETAPGVLCEKRTLPIERVGLYIPGGTAPLPSTLMMLAIPAKIAGCPEISLATPPQADGTINPVILTAASLLGITRIYKCGGVQAIAALAYGTETVAKVDKIFGPGNAWVTEAKMQVAFDADGAAIDMPAGPSEVLVIADALANPVFVAADLLSQAEHDRMSQVILLSTSDDLISRVQVELAAQLETLPRREIALAALSSSRAFKVDSLTEAMLISNRYAPEHLILQVEEARALSSQVCNAGSVFVGAWSPEAVGDYASGTNHVLPTYGFARAFSGVSVESFSKSISFQELSAQGLKAIGKTVETLASAEGLEAHRRAVSLRLKKLEQGDF